MSFGYYKVAAISFPISVGNPMANAKLILERTQRAVEDKVELAVFSELSVTGYTCADLFSRRAFLKKAEEALLFLIQNSANLPILICVGMPVEDHGRLFNCAVYIENGQLIGVVPKTYIPNYGEFYEKRWFSSSLNRLSDEVTLAGFTVPFNENLLLRGEDDLCIATEICEDLWVDSPPSGALSRAGATIIVNPSASNDLIGKREYRRNLVAMQSGRCRSGYVYTSCGSGESSTDLAFSGHCIIADNGHMVNESIDILEDEQYITGMIDLDRSVHDKLKYNSEAWEDAPFVVEARIAGPYYKDALPDKVDAYPFVPHDERMLNERCNEILNLQAKGLVQRLKAIGCNKTVIGISGGLDSTLALLVVCIAYDHLKLDRKGIYAITMPGFGTSKRTKNIADSLMQQLGVTYMTKSICDAVTAHLSELEHPMDLYDITYENAQARERTQILFDYANKVNGIVIGTGDMSEMALGWCTYNGDHMSNYAVNVGVPKTLVKYLVRAYALNANPELRKTLMDVFDLPISPELLPTDNNGDIAQKTEESIGKYDLHDFFLYHFMRNGFSREKIHALAIIAYPMIEAEEIENTLNTFFRRFRTQQFKRSCIPDGIKIGSVALSPRGDLRLPSDLADMY